MLSTLPLPVVDVLVQPLTATDNAGDGCSSSLSGGAPSLLWAGAINTRLLCGLTVAGGLVWLLCQPSVATPSWPVVWLLAGAPLVEEVIFRLGLHQEFLTNLQSASAANALTALVFAMAHGLTQGTWRSLLTLLPALVIGSVYQRSRRVAPCIALHAIFNALWLVVPGLAGGS